MRVVLSCERHHPTTVLFSAIALCYCLSAHKHKPALLDAALEASSMSGVKLHKGFARENLEKAHRMQVAKHTDTSESLCRSVWFPTTNSLPSSEK